ncbi:MAG: hypothetical protein WCT85_01655 [Parachlamydiales bacterium]|jgi:hypothetical protein
MNISKLIIKFSLVLIILAVVIKSWVFFTFSFRIDKIEPNEFFQNHWNVKLKVNPQIKGVLDQKYKLFNKGRQSFVFISDDNKYVIKLIRFHRYSDPFFVKFLDSLKISNNHMNKLKNEINTSYQETMNSYKIAYEQLSDETATIYVHLDKTRVFDKKLQVVDRLGQNHYLDLDKLGFVIQKKAEPFDLKIQKTQDDRKATRKLIESFFYNLSSIYKKNVFNNDRHLVQNLGIIDDQIVEIDIGRFAIDERLEQRDFLQKESAHYTYYLRKWILKNIPEHVQFFDRELIKLIESTGGYHD